MQLDLLTREIPIRPATFNAAARTVEVIAATATPVRRRDARGEYDEILDVRGADLAAFVGAPVLNGHRAQGIDNIIGAVINARVEGEEIIATLQLSERAEFAPIVRDIETGIIRNVSVGFTVEQWKE
jgi:hypothetical protein